LAVKEKYAKEGVYKVLILEMRDIASLLGVNIR